MIVEGMTEHKGVPGFLSILLKVPPVGGCFRSGPDSAAEHIPAEMSVREAAAPGQEHW